MDGYSVGQLGAALILFFIVWIAIGAGRFVWWLIRGTPTDRINSPSFWESYIEDGPFIEDPADDPFTDRTEYETFEAALNRGRAYSNGGEHKQIVKAKRSKSKYE